MVDRVISFVEPAIKRENVDEFCDLIDGINTCMYVLNTMDLLMRGSSSGSPQNVL
jgi:hypothetical protein